MSAAVLLKLRDRVQTLQEAFAGRTLAFSAFSAASAVKRPYQVAFSALVLQLT